jgi:predicted ATP-binding protein involved in virulence
LGGEKVFIEKIKINKVRHLENFEINLGNKKKHLIITGKNGSGKTSLFDEIRKHLRFLETGKWNPLNRSEETSKIYLKMNNLEKLREKRNDNDFFIASFDVNRKLRVIESSGVKKVSVEELQTKKRKEKNIKLNERFLDYLVNLKTQLAYAQLDNEISEVTRISEWFTRFENILKEIFEDEKLELIYDRTQYNFIIKNRDKEFGFNYLSDGFSSILEIITEVIMGMEKEDKILHNYDKSGIILIDELDLHLHISLQKKIFKILDKLFPNIQFIVTTHSPFILNSIENCVIFDLEKKEESKIIYGQPAERVTKDFFEIESTRNDEIEKKIEELRELVRKNEYKTEEFIEKYMTLENILGSLDEDLMLIRIEVARKKRG